MNKKRVSKKTKNARSRTRVVVILVILVGSGVVFWTLLKTQTPPKPAQEDFYYELLGSRAITQQKDDYFVDLDTVLSPENLGL